MKLPPRKGRGLLSIACLVAIGHFVPPGGPVLCRALEKSAREGGDWPPISQEERNLTRLPQDPEADAVVLNHERKGGMVMMGDHRVNTMETHFRIKILTERGRKYAEVRIPEHKHSRVEGIEARTVLSDGRIVPVEADQIFRKVVQEVGGSRETAHVFTFPAAQPGAILEYRYRRQDDSLGFIAPFFFAGPVYTLRARVSQGVPGDMSYSILCDRCPSSSPPTKESWGQGRMRGMMYARELHDLPGYHYETLMPPPRDATPRLEMLLVGWRGHAMWGIDRQDRFFIDWDSVARYAAAYYREAMKDTGDLKRHVAGWIRGIEDTEGKIRAIFRHVQRDIRYYPSTRVYGWSRSIEAILKDRAADNEEKAVLMIAALKTIGVTSYPALVCGRQAGSLHGEFYSLSQFTHTVVAIPKEDDHYRWLDPTVTYAPFDFVSWRNAGAAALLIRGNEGEIVILPPRRDPSGSRFEVTLTPRPDGWADAEATVGFIGEDAIDLREELGPSAETARESFLQRWVADRRPGAALVSHRIENLDEVEEPLRIRMQLRLPGLVTVADDAVLVRGCALTCQDTNPLSRRERLHPYHVDKGWDVEEKVMVRPGEGLRPGTPPAEARADSPVGAFILTCEVDGDSGVRCTRHFVARRGRTPATIQDSVERMFDAMVDADRSVVSLEFAGNAIPGPAGPGDDR